MIMKSNKIDIKGYLRDMKQTQSQESRNSFSSTRLNESPLLKTDSRQYSTQQPDEEMVMVSKNMYSAPSQMSQQSSSPPFRQEWGSPPSQYSQNSLNRFSDRKPAIFSNKPQGSNFSFGPNNQYPFIQPDLASRNSQRSNSSSGSFVSHQSQNIKAPIPPPAFGYQQSPSYGSNFGNGYSLSQINEDNTQYAPKGFQTSKNDIPVCFQKINKASLGTNKKTQAEDNCDRLQNQSVMTFGQNFQTKNLNKKEPQTEPAHYVGRNPKVLIESLQTFFGSYIDSFSSKMVQLKCNPDVESQSAWLAETISKVQSARKVNEQCGREFTGNVLKIDQSLNNLRRALDKHLSEEDP